MKMSAAKLAEYYGKDARTITNWLNMDPPCPSQKVGRVRMFDSVEVAAWIEARAIRKALAQVEPTDPQGLEQAKTRKLAAEALIAEIELAEKRRQVVPMEVCEAVGGEMADALRAILINAPSTYALDLERAGVPSETAEAVLEKLATDLTTALRGAVERVALADEDEDA